MTVTLLSRDGHALVPRPCLSLALMSLADFVRFGEISNDIEDASHLLWPEGKRAKFTNDGSGEASHHTALSGWEWFMRGPHQKVQQAGGDWWGPNVPHRAAESIGGSVRRK